jgi:Zn-dependent protease
VFIFIISGWVLSLCLHEFGHALLAFRAGDRDIEARGYLTLDPRKYTHPFLSIILPLLFVALGGIGLPGGAVWVNHAHIRGSRLRHAMISLIGPLINLGFAIVLGIAFLFVSVESVDAHRDFWASVGFLAILQFTAALLNILPIPGLDGGNAIEPYLNDEWKRGFAHVRPYGMLLVLALLWSPRANDWFFGLVFDIAAQFNIGAGSYFIGRALFWPFPGLF